MSDVAEQCCASHSADLERFLVTGSTVLDRLDRYYLHLSIIALICR